LIIEMGTWRISITLKSIHNKKG